MQIYWSGSDDVGAEKSGNDDEVSLFVFDATVKGGAEIRA